MLQCKWIKIISNNMPSVPHANLQHSILQCFGAFLQGQGHSKCVLQRKESIYSLERLLKYKSNLLRGLNKGKGGYGNRTS